jgi:hypothetical protein
MALPGKWEDRALTDEIATEQWLSLRELKQRVRLRPAPLFLKWQMEEQIPAG